MARCGCSGECGCCLSSTDGSVVISGTGSAANCFDLSTNTNCDEVRQCLTGTGGINFDQGSGVISVCISADDNNTLQLGSDGCLFGGTDCSAVRTCLDDGPGLDYNVTTGVFSVCISPNPGNNLALDDNDCLYVPTGSATVSTGCGVLGDGSGGSPVQANTGTWTWPCTLNLTNSTDVYCDPATGRLVGEPSHEARFRTFFQEFTYADLTVPSTPDSVIQSISATTTNPSTCRTAQVVVIQETDVYFSLPAGAQAAWGQGGDEFGRIMNTGATGFNDYHFQDMKMFSISTALAAGAGITHNWDVTMGYGSGGATYHRVVVNTRFLIITN